MENNLLKKYIKGDDIIRATDKAYRIIYKEEGYVPYIEPSVKKTRKRTTKDKDVK